MTQQGTYVEIPSRRDQPQEHLIHDIEGGPRGPAAALSCTQDEGMCTCAVRVLPVHNVRAQSLLSTSVVDFCGVECVQYKYLYAYFQPVCVHTAQPYPAAILEAHKAKRELDPRRTCALKRHELQ